jgi:hypothetical protein
MASEWLTERVCVVGTRVGLITTKGGDPTNRSWMMTIEEAGVLVDTLISALEMAERNRDRGNVDMPERRIVEFAPVKK